MISFCTTVNESYYDQYAKDNIELFSKYWPEEIKLYVYLENFSVSNFKNILFFDLLKESPSCKNFVDTYKNKIFVPKTKMKPYKYDFLKFCFKSYTMCAHYKKSLGNYFGWIDADIVTRNFVDIDQINNMLTADKFCWYLNRENNKNNNNPRLKRHSETGFIIFNTNHIIADDFFNLFQNLYDSGKLFDLEEQNDSYLFDFCRNHFDEKYFVKMTNGIKENPLEDTFFSNSLYHPMGKLKNEKRNISQ